MLLVRAVLALLLPLSALCGDLASESDFTDLVSSSRRAVVVEFYSGMCGYCATFAPTWQRFVDEATRLEARRVNIDAEDGSDLARRLGVLDHGIPAVLLFGVEGSDDYTVLMAGDVSPLSRLVKVAHKATRGLSTDAQGYFVKAAAAR
mmetsp:Transcript_14521/g.48685  ORF Transcript_14521/g.48685 Transcript_14521/m.48685 type:complete len:148 (+) Transcript_14521:210-653(+)